MTPTATTPPQSLQQESNPCRTVVIGVGSCFGADRLGWDTIAHLQERGMGDRLTLAVCETPGADLLRLWRNADLAVVVDAVQADGQDGKLVRLEAADVGCIQPRTSSHGFGLADAVALAKALGELPARLVILGLVVGELDRAPTAEQVEALARAVLRECGEVE